MSDAYREVANSLLDSINHQFISGIAESRGLTSATVRAVIDRAPMTPREMLKHGLVDEIAFFDELLASFDGPTVEASDYAQIDPASLGFDPVAQVALVYGSGNVVVGKGRANSRGNPVMASDTVADALEAAADDPEIDAIIFRIDSPGGSVLAADIIWRALEVAKQSEKPLIASFSNVAASGGYYVAAGADAILAPPGSVTGSIGVFALRPVLKGLLDKLDVNVERMTRGAHADLLMVSQPLSPETAAIMDREIEAIYRLFIERVAAGRKLDLQKVDAMAQGRVWTGEQALERGLIDELGGLSEAVLRAKQALDLDADADVALMPYPEAGTLAQQLTDTWRRISLEVVQDSPLKDLAERMQTWFDATPVGAPALVPPFVFDIR
jgi:protease-4